MSDATVFAFGVFASLIVAAAMGLLIWAALQDGQAHTRTDPRLKDSSLESRP